jgi:hypothetical protein
MIGDETVAPMTFKRLDDELRCNKDHRKLAPDATRYHLEPLAGRSR